MPGAAPALLLTGPGGVGKTTVAFEVGAGDDHQAPRTQEQARPMAGEPFGDRLVVDTSGRSVAKVASAVLRRLGRDRC